MNSRYEYIFTIEPTGSPINLTDSMEFMGDDISLIRDEEDAKDTQIQFTSIHLNELKDPIEIWNRAECFRKIYLGVNTIVLGYFDAFSKPSFYFRLVNLYKVNNNNEKITPVNIEHSIPMYPFTEVETVEPTDIKSFIIYLSKTNKDILSLLFQFGTTPNWISLYSILDTLEFYSKLKGKDIIKISGLNAKVNAFTGIANNFGLLSIDARHGELGHGTPQKNITLKEATHTIITLTRIYLNTFYGLDMPISNYSDKDDSLWDMDVIF